MNLPQIKTSRVAPIVLFFGLLFSHFAAYGAMFTQQDVERSVTQFGQAFVKADVATLKSLLCERYVHVNGNSGNIVKKSDWLKWVGSQSKLIKNGELSTNSYLVEDIQVELFDTFAIVTGIVKSEGIRKGAPFKSHLRFSNVWRLENGNLCRGAFHDSALPEN